jgi:signal peptidase II
MIGVYFENFRHNQSMKSIFYKTSLLAFIVGGALHYWLSSIDTVVPVLGSFAKLQPALNTGIAWSIKIPTIILPILIITVLGFVLHLAHDNSDKFSAYGYGLVFSGGLLNLIDRLPDSAVSDYFAVGTFPIFNVPDSLISIGVALLLWRSLKRG